VLAARLARALSPDYRFVFACLGDPEPLGTDLRAEGFSVYTLGKRPGLDWRCPFRLARLLRREAVDLLHTHQYPAFLYGLAGRLVSRRPPLLFTEHGRLHPDYPQRRRILFNRLLLERRDRVVGVGVAVCRALVENEGIPARLVGLIYNGIPLRNLPTSARERQAVRRELGLADSDVVVLQPARFDPVKDHATALRAMRQALRSRPNLRLLLAGDGPQRPTIEALVRKYDLGSRVTLLGLRRDVPRLLAASDVVLLTSVTEGIPLALIEAMAAGLPVVSTDVGGVSEVVTNGVTGLLAPAGDDTRLAEHLLTLSADPIRARQMGQQGRARALDHFSDQGMHAAYDRLYREMLAGQKGARSELPARACS
jgi:glycosyltransferase involved in cell wall biosynthesis